MNTIASYLNNNAATTGLYAAVDGATLHLADIYTLGGNVLANSSASLFTSTAFSGWATGILDASAVEVSDGEFELRIDALDGYQMRVFTAHHRRRHGARRHRRLLPTSPWGGGLVTNSSGTAVFGEISWSNSADDWTAVNADWEGQVINTQSAAQLALGALDDAITTKDTARAALGALQNRLENTITNQRIQAENLQAAESASATWTWPPR